MSNSNNYPSRYPLTSGFSSHSPSSGNYGTRINPYSSSSSSSYPSSYVIQDNSIDHSETSNSYASPSHSMFDSNPSYSSSSNNPYDTYSVSSGITISGGNNYQGSSQQSTPSYSSSSSSTPSKYHGSAHSIYSGSSHDSPKPYSSALYSPGHSSSDHAGGLSYSMPSYVTPQAPSHAYLTHKAVPIRISKPVSSMFSSSPSMYLLNSLQPHSNSYASDNHHSASSVMPSASLHGSYSSPHASHSYPSYSSGNYPGPITSGVTANLIPGYNKPSNIYRFNGGKIIIIKDASSLPSSAGVLQSSYPGSHYSSGLVDSGYRKGNSFGQQSYMHSPAQPTYSTSSLSSSGYSNYSPVGTGHGSYNYNL